MKGSRNGMKKADKICLAGCIVVMATIFILNFTGVIPDEGPAIIQKHLDKQGYQTEGIVFSRIGKWGHIYKASEPIELEDGTAAEYWKIYVMGPFSVHYIVAPYSEDSQ